MMTIPVEYSCDDCGVREARIYVRERGTENVVEWLRYAVTPAIQTDHESKSPGCNAEHISQVKIPLAPPGARVGDPVKH